MLYTYIFFLLIFYKHPIRFLPDPSIVGFIVNCDEGIDQVKDALYEYITFSFLIVW